MKKLSIKMAVLIPVLLVLVLGVVMLVVVVSNVASTSQRSLVDTLIEARVKEAVNEFTAVNNRGYALITTMAMMVDHIREHSADPRHEVIDVLTRMLEDEPDLQGIWTVWEPNAFDGRDAYYVDAEHHDQTGHFVPYIRWDGSNIVISAMQLHNDPVDGMFYLGAKRSGRPYVTDPYIYPINGVPTVLYSITIPMFDNGQFVGAVGTDFSLGSLASFVNNASILEDGYLFVLAPNGNIALHNNKDLVLQNYQTTWMRNYSMQIDSILTRGGSFATTVFSDVTNQDMILLAQGVSIGSTERYWVVAGTVPEATANAPSRHLTMLVVGVGSALVVLVGLVFWGLVSLNLRKLPKITATAERIAAGDLRKATLNKETYATHNEITLLERAFTDVEYSIHTLVDDLCEIGTTLHKKGDIDARINENHYKGAYQDVAKEINHVIDGISGDLFVVLQSLEDFGKGKFNATVPTMPGKKILINQAINTMSNDLLSLTREINNLTKDAMAGKLSSRVDTTKFNGDWVVLISGLNQLLEAIVVPINETSRVLHYVSEGNFNQPMEGTFAGDFKQVKDSVNTTVTQVSGYITEISAVLTEIADNNLERTIVREYIGSFADIKKSMNNIIRKLNSVIGDINNAANQVATGAKSISTSSYGLANGASMQAASVQELNATIAMISESAAENASKAKEAEAFAKNATENAHKGDADMKKMLTSMEEIKETSGKITKIIKVIEDIAFQTNLLALNASVEAARAGEHGKGFAVVADEVKLLASKSQAAAKETAELIVQSVEKVNQGERIATQTANTLHGIVDDSGQVAGIISQIATASHTQAEAVQQVTQGLSQIANVVQNNSATAQESAAAAEELTGQSAVLLEMTKVFKLKRG